MTKQPKDPVRAKRLRDRRAKKAAEEKKVLDAIAAKARAREAKQLAKVLNPKPAKPRPTPKNVFKKGHVKVGGRKKGTPNHITTTMKQAIVNAFNQVGGAAYLAAAARGRNYAMRRAFLSLCGKVVPLEVVGPGGGPLQHEAVTMQRLAGLSQKELDTLASILSKVVPATEEAPPDSEQ